MKSQITKQKGIRMKKKVMISILYLTAILTACNKDKEETPVLEQSENIPIVYETEEVKLCRYEGNTVIGSDSLSYPTETEIENEYNKICIYAAESVGDYYEDTDEWVQEHFTNLKTREELREAVIHSLIAQKQTNVPYENKQAVLTYIVEHSEVNCTEETRQAFEEQFLAMHKADAKNAGYNSFQAFLKDAGYENEEAFLTSDFFKTEVDNAIKMDLVTAAVAEVEGITTTDEEIEEYLDGAHFHEGSEEEYLEVYFMGDKENVRGYLTQVKVIEHLYNNTTFIDTAGKEIGKDEVVQ